MKKITILILFFTINLNAQWNSSYPNLSGNGEPKSMFFIDENIGFLGGNLNYVNPALTKTIDGGNTWSWITLPANNYMSINSIFFSDINNGFITTDNQNVNYKTIDGGLTWSLIFCQTNYPGKVYFKNNLTAFYYSDVSSSDNFSYSNNGGTTWTSINSFIGAIKSIHFPNQTTNIGYLMNSSGSIFKTIDNGINWNLVYSGTSESQYSSIYFINELKGFRISYSTFSSVERTLDGGVTWEMVNQISGKKILFTNSTTCYASGFIDGGINSNQIYKAIDQNTSILNFSLMSGTNTPIFNSDYILDIQFPTENIGYALSTNKNLYKVNSLLGTQEKILINTKIYPNPTKNIINIFGENLENQKFKIIDITGRIVKETNIINNQIDLVELIKGIYILKIEGLKTELKIIKE